MAKRRTTSNAESAESLETVVTQLSQEIRVLRQAIDELRVDFTHALRQLPDNLPPPYEHLATLAESFALEHATNIRAEVIAETLCCYECDAPSPRSLAQALDDGWIDLSRAEEVHGTNFVGWCPTCQQSYDEERRRLNAGPVIPQPVSETRPVGTSPKMLFE